MGCKELIEALRASGDEKIGALRQQAGLEEERIHAEAAQRIQALRDEQGQRKSHLAAGLLANHTGEARARIRQLMLVADRKLSERLYGLARQALLSLRNVGYEGVFRSFAAELPPAAWKEVRVHPADVELAKAAFPGAAVVPDPAISGGLVAETAEGTLRVDNTFEKRLERAWEDMLPEIMSEVKACAAESEGACAAAQETGGKG